MSFGHLPATHRRPPGSSVGIVSGTRLFGVVQGASRLVDSPRWKSFKTE
jgi:hypothetical protein